GLLGKRRNGYGAHRSALEKRLDLPIPFHAIGKTSPTGALAWPEHRSHQGENSGGLDEQPGGAVRQMLPVHLVCRLLLEKIDQASHRLTCASRVAEQHRS